MTTAEACRKKNETYVRNAYLLLVLCAFVVLVTDFPSLWTNTRALAESSVQNGAERRVVDDSTGSGFGLRKRTAAKVAEVMENPTTVSLSNVQNGIKARPNVAMYRQTSSTWDGGNETETEVTELQQKVDQLQQELAQVKLENEKLEEQLARKNQGSWTGGQNGTTATLAEIADDDRNQTSPEIMEATDDDRNQTNPDIVEAMDDDRNQTSPEIMEAVDDDRNQTSPELMEAEDENTNQTNFELMEAEDENTNQTNPEIVEATNVQNGMITKVQTAKEDQSENQPTLEDEFPLNGKWVYNKDKKFAVNVCCGWEHMEFLNHPEVCGTQKLRSWERENYRGPPADGFYQQTGGRACVGNVDGPEKFVDEWEWQSPDLPAFDVNATCELLGNRTVLLVGDSTMLQTASTLMNALKPGGCAPNLVVQSSDTLVGRNYGMMNRGIHHMTAVEKYQPDIVIYNTGPHVRFDNYTIVLNEVIDDLKKWQNSTEKKTTFVWRTNQPAGCTDEIYMPEDPIQAAKTFNFSASHFPKWHEVNHDIFYERDVNTMKRWKQEFGDQGRIMDLRMLYSRSDAHPGSHPLRKPRLDCLHTLIPGPLDIVAQVFQRLLVNMEQVAPQQTAVSS